MATSDTTFKKRKIYSKEYKRKYRLIKCEHTDHSISYKLADSKGFLISDHYNFPNNFEDVISVHPDHHASYNEMFQSNTKRSVLGEKLDEEMSKIQHSFYTLLEEVLIRI